MLYTLVDDQYEILSTIKSGGWGAVYKARQSALDRTVAIKVMHHELTTDPDSIKRFNREAKAAASIRSRFIANVYDHGVLPNGQPYLVLQYFSGEDLQTYIHRRGPLPAEVAIPMFSDLCLALSTVHSHDIIHRDIKPANILITENPSGTPEPKLIDFGLVGFLRRPGMDTCRMTEALPLRVWCQERTG